MSENCVTRVEYDKDIHRIDTHLENQDEKIEKQQEDIIALKTIWKNVAQMPSKIEVIEKTQIETNCSIKGIQDSLKRLTENDKAQSSEISKQKNRGKIDILQLVTDNAWKIILAIAGVIASYTYLFK